MQTIEQARAAAMIRIEARRVLAAEQAANAAKLKAMRDAGAFQALLVMAGMPMVRVGGNGLRNLREDVYDAMNNVNGHAGLVQDIGATYDSAMMGGEPFAIWN